MIGRWPGLGLLVAAAWAGLPTTAGRAAQIACPAAAREPVDAAPLPHFASTLHAGGTLTILAIGFANTGNPAVPRSAAGGSPPNGAVPTLDQTSFPWQVAHALEVTMHGLHVVLNVQGRRGAKAADALDVLRTDLPASHPQLVVWQTGTVDAAATVPPGDFYQALADGAALTEAAGADLVIVDPQYSRFLEANANLEPYETMMQAAGGLPGVVLFHRFELMRGWAATGQIDLEQVPRPDRAAAAARLHACLGRALAATLLGDVAASR